MEKFYLEKVTSSRKMQIIDYIKEFYEYNSEINGVGRLQDFVTTEKEDFELWKNKIEEEEKSSFPKICYLFIRKSDDRLIGMINIRMSKDLGNYEYGHVGYSIRPTERGKGYAKIQFYSALKVLQENKIDMCQMQCSINNGKSRNVIKSLGGTFEKSNENVEYYYIDVNKTLSEKSPTYEQYVI